MIISNTELDSTAGMTFTGTIDLKANAHPVIDFRKLLKLKHNREQKGKGSQND
jgi:chemotaxis signal transduction protein